MNFKDINDTNDIYYLNVNFFDNIEDYYDKQLGTLYKYATTKRLHTMSSLVYYSIKESSFEQTVEEFGGKAFAFFTKLGDCSSRLFAPNINIYSMSKNDAISLALRLYGYYHPDKNIF